MKPPVARYKTSPISFGDHHNRLDRGDWKDSDSLAGFRTVWSLDLATGFFFEVKISEKTEIDGRPVSVLEFDEPEMRTALPTPDDAFPEAGTMIAVGGTNDAGSPEAPGD